MPGDFVWTDRRAAYIGPQNGERDVWRAGMGVPYRDECLGLYSSWLGSRLGVVCDGGDLDCSADVGPLRFQRGCGVSSHARVSRAARGSGVLPRLYGSRTKAWMAGHGPIRLTGKLVSRTRWPTLRRIHGQYL